MKRIVSALMTCFLFLMQVPSLFAQDAEGKSIDEIINSGFQPVTDFLNTIIFFTVPVGDKDVPFVLIWLIVGAIFFTIYMKFVNIAGFKHALDVVRGKYDDPNDSGEVSHFQALTAALSGTVGVGNIAGVAIAVSLGGPGATFLDDCCRFIWYVFQICGMYIRCKISKCIR